jgi:hypothetical protein
MLPKIPALAGRASILRSVAKAERETESSPDERNGLNAPSRLMVDDHDSAEK